MLPQSLLLVQARARRVAELDVEVLRGEVEGGVRASGGEKSAKNTFTG